MSNQIFQSWNLSGLQYPSPPAPLWGADGGGGAHQLLGPPILLVWERWALEMSDLGPGPTSWPSSPCPTRTSHCSRTLSRVEVIPIRILPLEIAGLQFCTQSFSSQGALPLLPTEGCEELVLLDHVDLIVEEPITRLDPDYKSCYSLQAGFRIQTSLRLLIMATYGGMFPWNSSNEEMWLHLAHVPHDPGNPLTKTTVRKLLLLQAGLHNQVCSI